MATESNTSQNGTSKHPNLDELFQMLRTDIPEGRQTLLDTQSSLEKISDYCASAYLNAKDKKEAFEKTKNYTTHSLASVAYQVNTLAYNFLRMFELQANQLAEMESQVNFVSQKLAFHKEKVARREIALLTSAKTNVRKPKVFIPANEEKPQKYIRKPIDYSILDDIGHGIKIPNTLYRAPSNSSNRMSGTQTLGPKSSMSSLSHYHHYNTLGGSGPAPTTKPPTPPQANRSGFGTLGRSSQNKEYRALAPPIAPPQVPKNYESNYPIGHPKNPMTRQNSGNYSSGGQAQAANQYMPGYGNTSSASLNSNASNQYGQTMHQNMINPTTPPPPPLTQDLSSSSLGTSDLPDPPMHLRGSTHSGYDLHRQSTGSPPLPPPPPVMDDGHHPPPPAMSIMHNANVIYGVNTNRHNVNLPDWVPPNFIEKVVAIYDYNADKDDELTFKENSVIYVTSKNDDGWYEGVMNGLTGLFPCNYVEPCL